tara:strand:+ start:924 stop:1256 length:333 start_codon:yes stop_codon:yes gene_type:complete
VFTLRLLSFINFFFPLIFPLKNKQLIEEQKKKRAERFGLVNDKDGKKQRRNERLEKAAAKPKIEMSEEVCRRVVISEYSRRRLAEYIYIYLQLVGRTSCSHKALSLFLSA